MLLVTKLDNSVITETVTRGMAALLQSSVGVEMRDAERELFSIDYFIFILLDSKFCSWRFGTVVCVPTALASWMRIKTST